VLLMLDNYDSFTYNLVRYFRELGAEVVVYRNDEISLAEIEQLAPSHIVISPGPCTPDEAGISMAAIAHFAGKIPLLGVCLGHQSIGQVFGGKVVRAEKVMHGKTSMVSHEQAGVFAGLAQPVEVTRYHSLVVEAHSLPECLEATAWSLNAAGDKEVIMGIRHKTLDVEGVQFHPESVLTHQGHELLANFLKR
jgi:anthranilate synthase component 2